MGTTGLDRHVRLATCRHLMDPGEAQAVFADVGLNGEFWRLA